MQARLWWRFIEYIWSSLTLFCLEEMESGFMREVSEASETIEEMKKCAVPCFGAREDVNLSTLKPHLLDSVSKTFLGS